MPRCMLMIAACLIALPACRKPAEARKSALGEAGYQLTPADWMRAAAQGDAAALRKFLDAGFAVETRDAAGDSALHAAAAAGAEKTAAFLLDRGLPVDSRGAAARTPLMAAVLGKQAGMVRWLLQQGADPQAKDNDGFTPLMLAVREDAAGPLAELAPVQRESLDSALLLAALVGQAVAIDTLTNYGASVYARMEDGRTPLMIAAQNGHAAAVDLLLDIGSSRFSTDAEGRTAADLAAAAGHAEIAAAITRDPGSQELTLETPEEVAAAMENFVEQASSAPAGEPVADTTTHQAVLPIQGAVLGKAGPPSANADRNRVAPAFPLPPLVLRHYRERELPVQLHAVDGETATIKLMHDPPRVVMVPAGGKIPGSHLTIVRVQRRIADSKLNEGRPQEVSVVEVRDETSGATREWIAGVPVSAHDPVALVEDAATGRRYTAVPGQRFKSADGAEFIVSDVRPNQIVIEDAASGAVQTIPLRGPRG